MQKVYITINKFHEKKRRIEYANIKRRLNIPDEDIVKLISKILVKTKNKGEEEEITT